MNIAKLSGFFRQYQKATTTHAGRDFNVFKMVDLKHDEVKHTRILAWLLDREANHGQGTLFFDAFTHLCGMDCGQLSSYQVTPFPVGGSESTCDIRIHEDRRFVVDIEIKIDAIEGDDQCAKEYRDLQRFACQPPIPQNRVFAVFLTVDGSAPTTAGPSDRWIARSWEDVSGCFRAVEHQIASSKLRYLIHDWLEVIESFKEDAMDLDSAEAQFLMNNHTVWKEIVEASASAQESLLRFLLSTGTALGAKPWMRNGWSVTDYSKHCIYVSKKRWKVSGGHNVEIGVDYVNVENLCSGTQSGNAEGNACLMIWCQKIRRKQIEELLQGKLLPNDRFCGQGNFVIRTPLRHFKRPFDTAAQNAVQNEIIGFIDHYAGIIEQHSATIDTWR